MEPNQNQQQAPNSQPVPTAPNSNHILAALSYLGILIIIPFLTEARKDQFVLFHIKQGLVLIILELISLVINVVPVIGWLIGFVLFIFNVVMIIIGIINAVTGKQKELPLIGKFGHKFNF